MKGWNMEENIVFRFNSYPFQNFIKIVRFLEFDLVDETKDFWIPRECWLGVFNELFFTKNIASPVENNFKPRFTAVFHNMVVCNFKNKIHIDETPGIKPGVSSKIWVPLQQPFSSAYQLLAETSNSLQYFFTLACLTVHF